MNLCTTPVVEAATQTSPVPPICVVLVEPQGPLNIGSVARAMMNFGFADLRLVNPQTDHQVEDARRMAVKATVILDQARIYPDLPAALADCSLTLGTTRRFGKYREDFLHPDLAAQEILTLPPATTVALLFGREDEGLHTAELDLCQRLITIPTGDLLPSMNLAQAVSLCLYEIAKTAWAAPGKGISPRRQPAAGATVEAMFRHMQQTLLDIGFLNPQNPDHILRTFRRIFGRTALHEREIRILHGLWSRIDWVNGERRKCTGPGTRDEKK